MVVFQDFGSLEPPDAGQSASPPRCTQQRRHNLSQIACFDIFNMHIQVFLNFLMPLNSSCFPIFLRILHLRQLMKLNRLHHHLATKNSTAYKSLTGPLFSNMSNAYPGFFFLIPLNLSWFRVFFRILLISLSVKPVDNLPSNSGHAERRYLHFFSSKNGPEMRFFTSRDLSRKKGC